MNVIQQIIIVTISLVVVGDVLRIFDTSRTERDENGIVSKTSALLLPGAGANVVVIGKGIGKAAYYYFVRAGKKIYLTKVKNGIKSAIKKAKEMLTNMRAKKGGSEHTKNKTPSKEEKHQKGQARKNKDQDRAKNKKQKGAKDGSKKRPGGRQNRFGGFGRHRRISSSSVSRRIGGRRNFSRRNSSRRSGSRRSGSRKSGSRRSGSRRSGSRRSGSRRSGSRRSGSRRSGSRRRG